MEVYEINNLTMPKLEIRSALPVLVKVRYQRKACAHSNGSLHLGVLVLAQLYHP